MTASATELCRRQTCDVQGLHVFKGPKARSCICDDGSQKHPSTTMPFLLCMFTCAEGMLFPSAQDLRFCPAAEPTPSGWAAAAAAGAAAVSRYSGAAAGDRTMLDAILPAVEALRAHSGKGTAPAACLEGRGLKPPHACKR